MLDQLIQGMWQGLTQNNQPIYLNNNGNGFSDVIVKGLFGQQQVNSGLNLSQALDLINKLKGN